MSWTKVSVALPATGEVVLCRLQHYRTKSIQEHELKKVDQDDCAWRTADDNSEIDYNWTVTEWRSPG
jgi:hypothetical protein